MEDAVALERAIRAKVQRRVRSAIGFSWHLRVFVLVSILLVAINLLTTPLYLWCLFPIVGWGIGVVLHWFAARGRDEREAMIEAEVQRELTKRRAQQG